MGDLFSKPPPSASRPPHRCSQHGCCQSSMSVLESASLGTTASASRPAPSTEIQISAPIHARPQRRPWREKGKKKAKCLFDDSRVPVSC
jgi:hypothetical protein